MSTYLEKHNEGLRKITQEDYIEYIKSIPWEVIHSLAIIRMEEGDKRHGDWRNRFKTKAELRKEFIEEQSDGLNYMEMEIDL